MMLAWCSLAYYTDHVLQWHPTETGLILGPFNLLTGGCWLRRGREKKSRVVAIRTEFWLFKSKSKAVFYIRLGTTLAYIN